MNRMPQAVVALALSGSCSGGGVVRPVDRLGFPCASDGDCNDCIDASDDFCNGHICNIDTHVCVTRYCTTHDDCPSTHPNCFVYEQSIRGRCRDCFADEDCPTERPYCSPLTYFCRMCREDAHCSAPTPICKRYAGDCVECTQNEHCADPIAVCDNKCGNTHKCVDDCRAGVECLFGSCLEDGSCGYGACRSNDDCPWHSPACLEGCGGTCVN